MSIHQRPLNHACGEQAKQRFEAFNAKVRELSNERSAIEAEKRKLLDNALDRTETAPRLRFRSDALRDRTLQCDLDELALFSELNELEAVARADWLAEVKRLRDDHAKHLKALNGVADDMELEANSEQRTHLVDYDSMLVSQQRAIAHAEQMSETPLFGKPDRERLCQVQASIFAALT